MVLFLMVSVRFPEETYRGRIIEIRSGYHIVSNGFNRVLIYSSDDSIGLDDLVEFDTSFERVSGYDNFEVSAFPSWAKGQSIYYRGNVSHYTVVKKGCSLRRIIQDHYRNNQEGWASQLQFNNGMDIDSDFRYFITHAGFHVSFLVRMIRKVYERWFYREQARSLTFGTSILLGAIFGFPYGWVRVTAGLLAEGLLENDRDRTGFQACILMIYRPYYIKSVAFIIPMGLRFISLFNYGESSFFVRSVFLIMCQLRFYGYCEVLRMLRFSLVTSVTSVLYLSAIVLSFMPVSVQMDSLRETVVNAVEKIPSLYLNGRCDIILFAILVTLLMEYQIVREKRYVLYVTGLLLMNSCQSVLSLCYRVTYLDIGQGDCALVTFPFSSHGVLIDTGGNYYKDVGHDILVPYLRSRGLVSVDVILSHLDYDHSGGLRSLAKEFRVNRVFYDKTEKITVKGVDFLCLGYNWQYEDINDDSRITYLRLIGNGFLFLGDISKDVEERLVNDYGELDADVIKIAHHGSRTATSGKLLAAYQPQFAVISAGRNNRFNHPDPETIQLLQRYNVETFCTKEDHAIEFRVYRYFTYYHTAAGTYGLFFNSHD